MNRNRAITIGAIAAAIAIPTAGIAVAQSTYEPAGSTNTLAAAALAGEHQSKGQGLGQGGRYGQGGGHG